MDEIGSIFGLVNREVWIVTSAHRDRRGGLTATWVSAASIDPAQPTILVGIAPHHYTAELIDGSGAFGCHLLRSDQVSSAIQFAAVSSRDHDKLAGHATRPSPVNGVPILAECLAWLDCRVYSTLRTGDRIYYWADVVAGGRAADGTPLREHELFGAATVSQRQILAAVRDADIARQRPAQSEYRAKLPPETRT